MDPEQARRAYAIGKRAERGGDAEKARRFYIKARALFGDECPGQVLRDLKRLSESGSETKRESQDSRRSSSGNDSVRGGEEIRFRGATSNSTTSTQRSGPSQDEDSRVEEDQRLGTKRICACKSFYDVLELCSDCDVSQIKKQYRRMALKYHPDKCRAPRAEDAFKIISQAYYTLSDEGRRRVYDLGGGSGLSASANPTPARAGLRRGARFQAEEMSPEDIFRMFFGADGLNDLFQQGSGTFRYSTFPTQFAFRSARPAPQRGKRGCCTMFLQVLPVALLIVLLLNFGDRGPEFSLGKTGVHDNALETESSGIPYFVSKSTFAGLIAPENKEKRRIFDKKVDERYIQNLQDRCRTQRQRQFYAVGKSPTFACGEMEQRMESFRAHRHYRISEISESSRL